MNAVQEIFGVVNGFVEPGFEAVAEEFERNFTHRGELGAAFAAMHEGRMVVDLWGGQGAAGKSWQKDTLAVIYSGTKGLVAGCILKLIEQDRLDLDRPVAHYWPEFAQNGKAQVLVRHVVSHRSGVPGVKTPVHVDEVANYRRMEDLLAAQSLFADPDAYNCYHALSIGWLCGALIRRIDGRSLGQFFHEEIAVPLDMQTWIGLPAAEEYRVGKMERPDAYGPWNDELEPEQQADPTCRAVWGNPVLFPSDLPWNTRAYHAAEIGGAGGISDARSMARYYGCLAVGGTLDGATVFKPDTVVEGRRERSRFIDPFIMESMAFGTVFALQTELMRYGPAVDAFGHTGAGGSMHAAWPSQKTGYSYVMNQMRTGVKDERSRPLLEKLYRIVAEGRGKMPKLGLGI